MMLDPAIGDAYGAGFEYVKDRQFIECLTCKLLCFGQPNNNP